MQPFLLKKKRALSCLAQGVSGIQRFGGIMNLLYIKGTHKKVRRITHGGNREEDEKLTERRTRALIG